MKILLLSLWRRFVESEFALSITFHALLLVGLVVSVSITPPQQLTMDMTPLTEQMPVINATFIDPAVTQAKFDQARAREQQKLREQREVAKRKAVAERKKREVEAKRVAQKRAADKRAAEKKRQQKQARREHRELERKAQEEIAKKAAQAKKEKAERVEKLKREAEAQAKKGKQQRELEQQLAAEQAQIEAQETQRVMSEKQRYSVLIKSTIQRNLITNEAFKGKKCQLNIRLGIGGVVLKVDKIAGDEALCRAAISAVYKPSQLPVSRDPKVFAQLRDINLTVEQ